MSPVSATVNPNTYDPISDLQKQYEPPLGKRVVLVLNLNSACLVPGGVDTVLKSERGRSQNHAVVDESLEKSMDYMKNLHVSEGRSNHGAFDFLNEDGVSSFSSTTKTSGKGFKLATFGAKLKNHFDRGVTSIAVQAQKVSGDKAEIRDVLTVGAYIQDEQTGEYNVCLGMTERVEMPSISGDDSYGGDGITFQVPIVVPWHVLNSSVVNSGQSIQFHLWMRSGASLFAKNRALRRYVWVGSSLLGLDSFAKQIQPKLEKPFAMTIPFNSTFVHGGEMNLTVVPDTKFPTFCGIGWSLSEPRTDTAYNNVSGKRMLFNAPLDQNYIYALPHDLSLQNSRKVLLGTERLTESSVVLPLAAAYTQLLSRASEASTKHAAELLSKLQCLGGADKINDPMKALQQGHAQCQIEILHFLRYHNDANAQQVGGGKVHVTLNLQRPDSIFENCLASCTILSHPYVQNSNTAIPQYSTPVSVPFYPKIVEKEDPRLLPGHEGADRKVFVGKVRFQIYEEGAGGAGGDVFSPIAPAGVVGFSPRHLEAIVDLDSHLNHPGNNTIHINVIDLRTGEAAGALAISVSVFTLEGMVERSKKISGGSTKADVVHGGLISLVGLDTLMEDEKACYPHSDLNYASATSVFAPLKANATELEVQADRRKRQLATMGEFMSFDYMKRHVDEFRAMENKEFNSKARKYRDALYSPLADDEEELLPDKRKDPRPFRPSSSRMDPLLSAIGFNIHLQVFSLTSVTSSPSGMATAVPTALFQNVTCGAPADHFRGFSSKVPDDKDFAGGLRRLEASRVALAERVKEHQNLLINTVSAYYSDQNQRRIIPGRSLRHIPPSEHDITNIRAMCFETTQKLHSMTWEIASRRGNVFSQALGIGVSLYLAHVSDLAKLQKAAWAELWCRHGFLITFEGLLSAAGKELGMIEDASVGIAMLRMVSVVFVTDNDSTRRENQSDKFKIVDSPYLEWLRISPSGEGKNTQYLVEICVDANFYAQRIPSPLKNQQAVRFYPILYQMGVDIRQWGANAGANFGKKSNEAQDELDEDEVGIPDNDFLMELNFEALRKMNAYAHAVYLCGDPQNPQQLLGVTWEQAHSDDQQIRQPIHPMLNSLYSFIRSSATKIEHGILDEAAFAAAKLGGGSAIFCKSGKDRTAMQVTFKQSQFVNRFIKSGGDGFAECDTDSDKIFSDATTMRVYGTRLPICDKNVGQSLYAFNSLQARFMPDPLKPPPRALAGFLKGGRVFTGGAIES